MKIKANERIFFDGTYVSNGHWAAHTIMLDLKGTIGDLVKSGEPFSYVNKELRMGSEGLPDIKKVMDEAVPVEDGKTYVRSQLFVEFTVKGEYGRVFKAEDGSYLILNERYVQGLGIDSFELNKTGACVCEGKWIILPVKMTIKELEK